jgi:hypothetical protein
MIIHTNMALKGIRSDNNDDEKRKKHAFGFWTIYEQK